MAKQMHHSHVLKYVYKAAWIIAALAALNVGLTAFDYDFFMSSMVQQNMANLVNPIKYVVLAAGILSLVSIFMPHESCAR